MGSGYLGGLFPGAYSNGGSAPDEAESDVERRGKYQGEHADALATLRGLDGFRSDHESVRVDISDAGV